MERMLEKAPVLQLEAQRLENQLGSRVGEIAVSRQNASHENSSDEIIKEVESLRYGELVIGTLQVKGAAEDHAKLMRNMGYEFPQKGRKNNIKLAVQRLEELGLVETEQAENSRKIAKIFLSETGQAYEVNPEIIEKIKTNSDDQNI